ncbi:hypothetical protein [Rickettsiella massiliensis]|uniref:hypothetical protein n=1 Tax=Rickettsiella massiliensis TaxID=676517 RepID=UPI00029B452F|nr:hypothetical protein [Rickettsiella massiliensis]
MSYSEMIGSFFQEFYDFKDDELNGWYIKLKKELDEFYNELDSRFQHRVCNDRNNKEDEYLLLLTKLKDCFKGLDQLLAIKNELTLDDKNISLIKKKITDFNDALEPLEAFIKEEMYSNKLECIILKLKSTLLAIANYFLERDLQYSRIRVISCPEGSPVVIKTAGPATHSTPRYILPERSRTLSFFSKQIDDALEKKQFQSHCLHNPCNYLR